MRGLALAVMLAGCGRVSFHEVVDSGFYLECTVLDVSMAGADGGFAVGVAGPLDGFGILPDWEFDHFRSSLRLFEDDVELGPAHAYHIDIRGSGLGRFSHWRGTGNIDDSIRWSASDNSDPRTNGRVYRYCNPTPASRMCKPIEPTAISQMVGFEWALFGAPDDFGPRADRIETPAQSTLQLYENGFEQGPAHERHDDIRNLGLGRFSHWYNVDSGLDSIRFATSDNTSPLTNGRAYSYCN